MAFDWQLAERMQCSRAEKEELVPLIDLLVRAAEKSREEGLLALEDDVRSYTYPLLRLGMQLVVDGTDPEIIGAMLRVRILSGNKRGKGLLEQLIICDGALSIQSGDNPKIIEEKCFSYLGEEADELKEKYTSETWASRAAKSVEDYINSDGTVTECFAEMRKILSLDDRAVQKVLREVDTSELALSLSGSDSEVRSKILKNMSRRAAVLLVSDAGSADPKPDAVVKHVAKMFEIVAKLAEAGEITLPD